MAVGGGVLQLQAVGFLLTFPATPKGEEFVGADVCGFGGEGVEVGRWADVEVGDLPLRVDEVESDVECGPAFSGDSPV